MRKDISSFILSGLNNNLVLRGINHTNLVSIPKIKNPSWVKDFRSISLCNVIYKIVSKVLANRLKNVLPRVIIKNQSAFVPGRSIFDKAIVAFETIHFMRNKRKGREGHMAIKLDMSKAYDRVEWLYLEEIMRSMGLSSHLYKGEIKMRMRGVAIRKLETRVSHILFADDSILSIEVKEKEAAFGQVIKLFNANTKPKFKTKLMDTIGIYRTMEDSSYLGLPIAFGREKCGCLGPIKQRVWSSIQGWRGRILSQAERVVFI
ncbi:uncharacterized protein LOC111281580 [Durio zibethinus]|uniref:Uncharacterized protein LOC111281580 n=1 Tax=Durio zibethinus TaxID=66656 RepID=A0A6P5X9E1_DURZI|nr:uncharacterized protein LOC111281580 [Durio zibethinus]